MQNYLQELEVTYFVSKFMAQSEPAGPASMSGVLIESSKSDNQLDLLILLERFDNPDLDLLFAKILAGIKLVKNSISYEVEYFTDLKQLPDSNKHRFAKVLVFTPDQSINITNLLSNSYNLNSKDILLTSTLPELHNNLDTKKQLWQDLKIFLA